MISFGLKKGFDFNLSNKLDSLTLLLLLLLVSAAAVAAAVASPPVKSPPGPN